MIDLVKLSSAICVTIGNGMFVFNNSNVYFLSLVIINRMCYSDENKIVIVTVICTFGKCFWKCFDALA